MKQLEDPFFVVFVKSLKTFIYDAYAIITGSVVGFIGYLLPIRNIVHFVIALFICDVFFGYWAAKKIRNERFSVKIIWDHTMPRMLVSIVLITGAFVWDEVYKQEFVSTYKIIGWFISGVLLYSIAKNGYKISKWSAFDQLGGFIQDKVKDATGIDIENQTNEIK